MKKTINFMGVRNIAFAITALLTVLALVSWFYKGLNFGLDFTGGTLIELRYEQPADLGKIRQELVGAGFEEAVVQSFGARDGRTILTIFHPTSSPGKASTIRMVSRLTVTIRPIRSRM